MLCDQWTKFGQTGFGLFAPKQANFLPQTVNLRSSISGLGSKWSQLKCETSVFNQSGQVTFLIFNSQKSLLDQSGRSTKHGNYSIALAATSSVIEIGSLQQSLILYDGQLYTVLDPVTPHIHWHEPTESSNFTNHTCRKVLNPCW